MDTKQRFYDYDDINDFTESEESDHEENEGNQLLPNKDELPEYACDYCGYAHKDSVVKCT